MIDNQLNNLPPNPQPNPVVMPPAVDMPPANQPANLPPSQNRRKLLLAASAFVVVLLVTGAYYLLKSSNPSPSSSNPASKTSTVTNSAAVSITADGLVPATIRAQVGSTVTWTNDDKAEHTLSFIGHDDYSSDVLKANDTFSQTFDKAGTYPYQDKAAGDKYSGSVIVQ